MFLVTGAGGNVGAEVVRALAAAGAPVRALTHDRAPAGLPDDEARAEMSKTTPPEYVDAFFDFYVAGSLDESQVRPTVEDLLGRPPRRFEQWARDHAAAFG